MSGLLGVGKCLLLSVIWIDLLVSVIRIDLLYSVIRIDLPFP